MPFRLLADLVVVIHLAFVALVVAGGVLALRWPRIAWLQVPAALWGVIVEWSGRVCPLTPLESWLRVRGGEQGYGGDFVARYLLPVLYPAGLTRSAQIVLGGMALLANLVAYALVLRRKLAPRTP